MWGLDTIRPAGGSQAGAYFVTLCTRGRECMLDDPVVAGIITDVWHALMDVQVASNGWDEK